MPPTLRSFLAKAVSVFQMQTTQANSLAQWKCIAVFFAAAAVLESEFDRMHLRLAVGIVTP